MALKLKFGETEYSVPKMNIGQLEEVTTVLSLPPTKSSFAILKIAMRRAEPKLNDVGDLEAGVDEIATAVAAILESSGFKNPKAADPNQAAPESGAAS